MFKFGKAFTDNISRFRPRKRMIETKKLRGWGVRLTSFYILLLIFSFLLLVRLFHLTVVKGKENRELSDGNRIRTRVIHGPRGIIYDRYGKPLVENILGFRLTGDCGKDVCTREFINETQWKKTNMGSQPFYYERGYLRQYLYPKLLAHTLGYLGEISAAELENPYYIYQDYLMGDWVGRMGLEKNFEKKLRGVDGKELIEVDAQNRIVRTLGKVDPISGSDLYLSLDLQLQRIAYEAMGEYEGAVVVTRPLTGEVLALVSTPSFNPNIFGQSNSDIEVTKLLQSPDRPLFNRAVSGVYPPGSIFKPIVAVAGLETGKITKQTQYEDTGILRIGEFSFSNWYFTQYGGTEGWLNIVKAIARSNDIFFYKLGAVVGINDIAIWGKKFGIGKITGIELPNEAEGLMPDPVWRKQTTGADWYLGDDYHIAIGQGELQTTPLQVNAWTNAIASKGKLCPLTLFRSDKTKSGSAGTCTNLNLKESTVDVIWEGMLAACSNAKDLPYQGTGWPLFDFTVNKEIFSGGVGQMETKKIPLACKTGTAEFGDPQNRTHAWFTAFGPLPADKVRSLDTETVTGDPEIAVTVLVEKGGEGSSVAAPVAKKIFEEWFKR